MTEEEIYKARAEGLNIVSELRRSYSDKLVLELLDLAFHVSKLNSPKYEELRTNKILEKAEARKRFIRLFENA
jgi:hypothetical protein